MDHMLMLDHHCMNNLASNKHDHHESFMNSNDHNNDNDKKMPPPCISHDDGKSRLMEFLLNTSYSEGNSSYALLLDPLINNATNNLINILNHYDNSINNHNHELDDEFYRQISTNHNIKPYAHNINIINPRGRTTSYKINNNKNVISERNNNNNNNNESILESHFKLPLLEQEPEAIMNGSSSNCDSSAFIRKRAHTECWTNPNPNPNPNPKLDNKKLKFSAEDHAKVEEPGSSKKKKKKGSSKALKQMASPSPSSSSSSDVIKPTNHKLSAASLNHTHHHHHHHHNNSNHHEASEITNHNNSISDSTTTTTPTPTTYTHIAVERNRRKLMNEHLAILRSLMPKSYVQRADQASIIGGVVDFINELKELVESLEARKRRTLMLGTIISSPTSVMCPLESRATSPTNSNIINYETCHINKSMYSPTLTHIASKLPTSTCHHDLLLATSSSALAEVDVRLEGGTHVILRTRTHNSNSSKLSMPCRQLLGHLVSGLERLSFEILHLHITSDPQQTTHQVLYTFTLNIGIECRLSVDELADAVQQIFKEIYSR